MLQTPGRKKKKNRERNLQNDEKKKNLLGERKKRIPLAHGCFFGSAERSYCILLGGDPSSATKRRGGSRESRLGGERRNQGVLRPAGSRPAVVRGDEPPAHSTGVRKKKGRPYYYQRGGRKKRGQD